MNGFTGTLRVEQVVFEDPDCGFAVVRVSDGKRAFNAIGALAGLVPGNSYRMSGEFAEHPRYGVQLRVDTVIPELPTTPDGVSRFLAAHVPGVGPETAAAVVQYLGPRALEIIETDPERLFEVPGVGPTRAKAIADAVRGCRLEAEVLSFLHGAGCTPALARKIVAKYGTEAPRVVINDPYRLAEEVWGIGFATADRIAAKLGVEPTSTRRISAGIRATLVEALANGDCALVGRDLVERASQLLSVPEELVQAVVDRMEQDEKLVRCGEVLVLREMWEEEVAAAKHVARLLRTRRALPTSAYAVLSQILARQDLRLSDEQLEALRLVAGGGVTIITGNPGTGKTTTLRVVAELFHRLGMKVAAACPTGRAAQRLEELSGHPAMTIHRLLGYNPREGFAFGEGKDLPVDAVLVDEASMVDLPLFRRLLEALPNGCTLVLVGDADQLPPVGPGDVLRDLIRSGTVPCVRLSRIFRQAARSLIITNAHRIVRGQFPVLPTSPGQDVLFIPSEDPEEQVAAVVRAVTEIAPSLGYDPCEVPVFCPMYRGQNGIDRLNNSLREAVNPPSPDKPEIRRGRNLFRLGDRVLQVVNNYEKGVMNGDLGVITAVDLEADAIEVAYPQDTVRYRRQDLDEIVPAWAISVHKAQGGEYPASVVLLDTRHYVLLTRNLLYTALTRAQRLCIVVGSRKAVGIALRNNSPSRRLTTLARHLSEAAAAEVMSRWS